MWLIIGIVLVVSGFGTLIFAPITFIALAGLNIYVGAEIVIGEVRG